MTDEIDWEIRPYEAGDAEAVRALLTEAFPSDAEARLVEELRKGGDTEIEFLADANGEIIGHVLLSRMKEPERTLALAPVATAEAFRRQGIAASLIESALAQALANDWRGVFVLGDLSYYERFGFDAAEAEVFDSPYAGEHFALVHLDDDEPVKGKKAVHADAFSQIG
ncbi:GNAT family N-acetyltransferase [Parvularcula lutaonensis]|uniref:GNAT family N-acetyltransferase n=1 Tax=Parvularcula lutaonensis TaxID=491923 RepID=A0ABV7MDP9_9PROT|nr:N-acetyltransferase [Parvularcula lutaonensis]GGY53083.1 hypothetical protein GCM10007148_22890 [Parvularcula lutaonensis]